MTRQNIIEIGTRSDGLTRRVQPVPEESLMLTGDERRQRAPAERSRRLRQVVPEARSEAERFLQAARAYREQAVAEATGQTARFLKIYEEYKKAPEVTRKRMYLETIERVLGGTQWRSALGSRRPQRCLESVR